MRQKNVAVLFILAVAIVKPVRLEMDNNIGQFHAGLALVKRSAMHQQRVVDVIVAVAGT